MVLWTKWISFALVLLTSAATLPARTTTLSPGDSIASAVSTAQPGDIIYIHNGVYRESVHIDRAGTPAQPITLRAETPGKVILDGGGISGAGWYINLEGLTVRNVRNGPQNENAAIRTNTRWMLYQVIVENCTGTGIGVFGDDVSINDCVSRYNGHNGIGGANCRRVLVQGCEVDHNNRGFADPPWKNNENARNVKGLWVFNAAWEGGGGKWAFTFGVTIKNCRYHDNGGPGIWFDAENRNFRIEANEVYNNVGISEDWEGMGISNEINFGPCVIQGNYVHDNSGSNIAVQESTDTTITGNWIVNGGIELRAMANRDPGLKNVNITGNFFKNAGIYTSAGSWSRRSGELRQIAADGNTYDNPGKFGNWAGNDLKSLDDLRALNFEKSGKTGTFDLPQIKPLATPATTHVSE